MGRKMVDITGIRFGKLTAKHIDHRKGCRTYWFCTCDCGGNRIVSLDHLKRHEVTDCGCYRKHISHWNKHGMYDTRLYRIWSLMKERCYNTSRKEYPNYGGRGIIVCEEWIESKNFIEWSLNNGYSYELTLDRINNDGNYCPENCRWVERSVQGNNKRNNRLITYKGETKTITQWAKENGMTYFLLKNRIDRLGWSFERAISEPVNTKYSNKNGDRNGGIFIQ